MYLARENRPPKSTAFASSAPESQFVPFVRHRGTGQLLCQLEEKPLLFVTSGSQMSRIMPHFTSCRCSWKFLFCSI